MTISKLSSYSVQLPPLPPLDADQQGKNVSAEARALKSKPDEDAMPELPDTIFGKAPPAATSKRLFDVIV